MSDAPPWLRAASDAVVLRVRVGPGASRSGVVGLHGEALRVRVTARPVGGAANRELLRVLADVLGIRPGDLELEAGAGAREKRVRIRGLPFDVVRGRLAAVLSVDSAAEHN